MGWQPGNISGLDLAINGPPSAFQFNAFGTADDIQTVDPPVDVWNGFHVDGLSTYTFSTTAAIDTISSSNVNDIQNILITGLDSEANWHVQTVTLSGQSKVTLTTPLLRVNRILNISATDISGVVRLYEDTAIVAGVPTDLTKVRCLINGSVNISQMAVFSTPKNFRCFLLSTYSNVGKAAGGGSKQADVFTRFSPFGSSFVSSGNITLSSDGTSIGGNSFVIPVELPKSIDGLWRVGDVSANGTRLNAGFDLYLTP